MAGIKLGVPKAQYFVNILIAMLIIALVFRMLPEQYTRWFRW